MAKWLWTGTNGTNPDDGGNWVVCSDVDDEGLVIGNEYEQYKI